GLAANSGTRKGSRTILDIRFCMNRRHTKTHFLTLEARHAGWVAEQGGGVVGRGGTAREGRAHTADALFVEGETCSQCLSGKGTCRNCDNGLQPRCFHYCLLGKKRSDPIKLF